MIVSITYSKTCTNMNPKTQNTSTSRKYHCKWTQMQNVQEKHTSSDAQGEWRKGKCYCTWCIGVQSANRKSQTCKRIPTQIHRYVWHLKVYTNTCVHVHTQCAGQVRETVKRFPLIWVLFCFFTDIQCTVYPISSSGLIYFYSYIIDLLSGTVSIEHNSVFGPLRSNLDISFQNFFSESQTQRWHKRQGKERDLQWSHPQG